MPSLTIREIDKQVLIRLKAKAASTHTDLDSYLRKVLGCVAGAGTEPTYRDLERLAGTWRPKQAREFARRTRCFRRVDKELW